MGVYDLLKVWTDCAYKLLEVKFDLERIETLNKTIHGLSKFGITDLVIYNIVGNEITIRYKEKGSRSFSKVLLEA